MRKRRKPRGKIEEKGEMVGEEWLGQAWAGSEEGIPWCEEEEGRRKEDDTVITSGYVWYYPLPQDEEAADQKHLDTNQLIQ